MVNKSVKLIFKVAVSSFLLIYLAFKVDWPVFINALSRVEFKFYLISTLLALTGVISLALKYYLLIKGSTVHQSLVSVIKINLIGRYYALFFPYAQEVVRWYKVTSNEKGRSFFLASTVFERSTFILLLMLTGLMPLFFYPSNPEIISLRTKIWPLISVFLVFTVITIAYFFFPVLQSFLRSVFTQLLPSRGKWQNLSLFIDNFVLKNTSPPFFIYIFSLGILWQLIFIGRVFFLILALAVPLSFVDAAWMGSLVLLLQTVPVSIAGIGVREGAYAYLFTLFNLPPEQGVLIGILFFSQMLLFAVIGGIFELLEI